MVATKDSGKGDQESSPVDNWAETLLAYGAVIESDPHETIVPEQTISDEASESARSVLRRLGARSGAQARVELAHILAEGGMGVVFLARQVALDREVAVKRLRAEQKSAANTTRLLHEAWIIGALEHPNVVPVYDIEVDREGHPLVVLKRIEGVHWGTLIADGDTVRQRFGAQDLLEWNLGILMQVLNAVRFAHSRGIIHRDLKPENVMIGEFGEVYLVDWGLAMRLHEGESQVSDAQTSGPAIKPMAGTPRYMAPEMLGDSDRNLSERTDVYLAGAVLYQILTGEPPHRGETAPQILFSIVQSQPQLPDRVPVKLAEICRKAMAKDPAQRFTSVEDMRLAIQDYLQHRDSDLLAERASACLAKLVRSLAEGPGTRDEVEHRQEVYRLFGESRFGFREALAAWPENQTAREGREQSARLIIEYELDQGNPRSAAGLLAGLPEPSPELRARIDEALAADEADKARVLRLEALERKLDTTVGQRTRRYLALLLGVLWVLSPWLHVWSTPDHVAVGSQAAVYTRSMLITGSLILVAIGLAWWAYRTMVGSIVNLRYFLTLIAVYLLLLLLQIGFATAGVPYQSLFLVRVFFILAILTMLTITMEHRFWPCIPVYAAAFVIIALEPKSFPYAQSVANLWISVNAAWIWRNRASPTRG